MSISADSIESYVERDSEATVPAVGVDRGATGCVGWPTGGVMPRLDPVQNVLERYDMVTTVSELTGMRIAAISGSIAPPIASEPATRL